MTEQFKLTVYIGGSETDLPERLIEASEVVITSKVETVWNTGMNGVLGRQEGTRVEVTVDALRVPLALDVIGGWFEESGVSTILVEIHPTFLRSVDRDS